MTPSIPHAVLVMLADRTMREHHAMWHMVRGQWSTLPAARQAQLSAAGWTPPRQNPIGGSPDPGAGIDFLAMHRDMIKQVNQGLAAAQDPQYAKVVGWAPIPWNPQDVDWPMPPLYAGGSANAKAPAMTDEWRATVAARFENDAWLRTVSLDQLGSEIENGIHNWMHMHWAAAPWSGAEATPDDPRNDYLGSTYSSHVNKVFWKLHGWIDARIDQWAHANQTAANLTAGWSGPAHMHHGHGPSLTSATPTLTVDERKAAQTFFLQRL